MKDYFKDKPKELARMSRELVHQENEQTIAEYIEAYADDFAKSLIKKMLPLYYNCADNLVTEFKKTLLLKK